MSRPARNRWLLWVGVLIPLGIAPGFAAAQDLDGVRIYQEELRVRLDQQIPSLREVGYDAGGWFNFAFYHFDDDPSRRQRSLSQYELRGWASVNAYGVHSAYVRGLLRWNDWANDDNPTTWRENEFDEVVERAWYKFDLGRAIANQTGQTPDISPSVTVGRQHVELGTGLALSHALDAVRFDVDIRDLRFTALLGQTIRDWPGLMHDSILDSHNERCLYGFQLQYNYKGQHRPFVYYYKTIDHTSPAVASAVQRYDYSPEYLGVGSEGNLFLPDLTYKTELVAEWGKGYPCTTWSSQENICAMAYDLQLEYVFDEVQTDPRLFLEYLYASGDSDRQVAGVIAGGNQAGTRDEAFTALGFRDTGVAFAPRVSNLHMLQIGARCFPLENKPLCDRLEIGTMAYFYMKDKGSGGMSDPSATVDATWAGWEWDAYCNWRITSDLSFSTRYGVFFPGAAFPGGYDNPRHFFYSGLSLSF